MTLRTVSLEAALRSLRCALATYVMIASAQKCSASKHMVSEQGFCLNIGIFGQGVADLGGSLRQHCLNGIDVGTHSSVLSVAGGPCVRSTFRPRLVYLYHWADQSLG